MPKNQAGLRSALNLHYYLPEHRAGLVPAREYYFITMTFNTRYSNINLLWSSLIIEELWRLGVRHCCIAPGSRSAPLTLLASEHPGLTCHVHFDERGLAFYALGLAKTSGEPVAIITTSGTAVANLYPAIIEARQTGVPLVVLTADRPPELIDCGANQAIDQQDIYGGYPGAVLNLPAPNLSISANWLLTSIDQSFARSCQQGLPLHVNCRFREPLYPDEQLTDYSDYLAATQNWMKSGQPHTVYQLPSLKNMPVPGFWGNFIEGKGIIVAGRIDARIDVEAIVELARALNWPLIADSQSQLHGHSAAVKHHDLVLASDTGQAEFKKADCLFQIGGHLLSKRLDQFISQQSWNHYLMLGSDARRLDTGHRQTLRLVGDIADTCRNLARISQDKEKGWESGLYALGEQIRQIINKSTDNNLTELWLGTNTDQWLPDNAALFAGNSLPVRMLELFSCHPLPCIFTNRGVSGIDGLMATAAGCATALAKPMVMLVGDVSFLHDLNSLALARQINKPMVIILVNNDGGNIFNMLPMGTARDKAQEYFVTPHGLDGEHAAAMFNIPYHAPGTVAKLVNSVQHAMGVNGCTLIEVKTLPGQASEQIKQSVRQIKESL